jgi:1-phosphofructokinase
MNNASIRTLSLNPAVDRTVHINNFAVNQVNRIDWSRLDPGGKGINVSKTIHSFGGRSRAYAVVAGNAGRFIQGSLHQLGIEHTLVWVKGETRTNIKIVDPLNKTHTDINEQGPLVTEAALEELETELFKDLTSETILVCSGSIGRGTPPDIYRRWIQKAQSAGAMTILDADGEALRLGLEAHPTLIKPNIHELERLLGEPLQHGEKLDLAKIAAAGRTLLDGGIEIVVISLGSEGALFLNDEQSLFAPGIPVEVKSTVGAGDAMVAALALCLQRRDALPAMVVTAVGAGTAAVATEGTAVPTAEILEHFTSLVTFKTV